MIDERRFAEMVKTIWDHTTLEEDNPLYHFCRINRYSQELGAVAALQFFYKVDAALNMPEPTGGVFEYEILREQDGYAVKMYGTYRRSFRSMLEALVHIVMERFRADA